MPHFRQDEIRDGVPGRVGTYWETDENGQLSLFPLDDRQFLNWLLVLSARGIPHHPARNEIAAGTIKVAAVDADRARSEIALFERENANWPPAPPDRPSTVQSGGWSAVWVSLMLAGLFLLFGPYHPDSRILNRAVSIGARVADGEWWRLITSLGVHGDFKHLGANLVSLLAFGVSGVMVFGGGLIWLGGLLAAGGANAISGVLLNRGGPISFGASTGVFALLGMLVGQRFVLALSSFRRATLPGKPNRQPRQWLWQPLGAAAAIFAMLGTAPNTNVAAHFWGLVCGMAMGAMLQALNPRRVPVTLQRLLEMLAFGVFLYAWRQVLA